MLENDVLDEQAELPGGMLRLSGLQCFLMRGHAHDGASAVIVMLVAPPGIRQYGYVPVATPQPWCKTSKMAGQPERNADRASAVNHDSWLRRH